MEKQYFVTLYSTQAKNQLEKRLYDFANTYEHTIVDNTDISEIKMEYRRILDSYIGRARKPAMSIAKCEDSLHIVLSETTTMILTEVKPKPEKKQ